MHTLFRSPQPAFGAGTTQAALRFAGRALLLGLALSACAREHEPAPDAPSNAAPAQETPIYFQEPAWSPDGTRIAFYTNRDGNFEIYTVRPDGTDLKRLTDNDARDTELNWSPDGTRIAFISNRDGQGTIYVMNADGTDPARLLEGRANSPVWSPDGARIAYESRVDGNNDIFVMQADGSGITRLTEHEARDFRPTWSPDGARIAFYSNRGGTYDLYVMQADGSKVTRLTDTETHEARPVWSPTDDRLLFMRVAADGETELGIFTLDVSTGAETRLTTGAELEASWSPDARRIAFRAEDTDGVIGLYVMDADGTNRVRILPR